MPRKKKIEEAPVSANVAPDAEREVKEFIAVEANLKAFQEYLDSGEFMTEILAIAGSDPVRAAQEWKSFWAGGRNLIEEYNVKIKAAKDALRSSVQLTPTQWRGTEGKADFLQAGPFKVSSVTKRSFDAPSLFNLVNTHGLLESLYALTTFDKDGKEVPMVRQEWKIDYAGVLQWLKNNKLDDVIDGAYDEKESTPQVKGPKELAFFGDPKSSNRSEE